MHYLDFEQPVAEFEAKIEELRAAAVETEGVSIDHQIEDIAKRATEALEAIYARLSPWQTTQIARHPDRPRFRSYLDGLFDDFHELCGDRKFGDDPAIRGGLARFRGEPVLVLGQEKGIDTESRLKHNFGMARPEGYRKAARLMALADRFGLPVLAFVDTAGAYPGVDAEKRGQSEAIARCIDSCLSLTVPNIAIIIGEGGSGGAVAIATANQVLMLEHAVYTVASPEASASILWRDSSCAEDAAASMRITARDLVDLGFPFEIVPEPLGGAHRNAASAIEATGSAIAAALAPLCAEEGAKLQALRAERYQSVGTIT